MDIHEAIAGELRRVSTSLGMMPDQVGTAVGTTTADAWASWWAETPLTVAQLARWCHLLMLEPADVWAAAGGFRVSQASSSHMQGRQS